MGKETKIGLAVIGVLLLGFGGLLVRRVITSDGAAVGDPEPPRSAQTFTASAEGKPTVVMAQRESAEQQRAATAGNSWTGRGEVPSREPIGDAPRASYMPAESVPAVEAPQDREIRENEAADDDQESSQSSVHRAGNPFGRSLPAAGGDEQEEGTPPGRLEVNSQEAAAIEQRVEPPRRGARNPLRRTSAQVPLNDADTLGAAPTDSDAADAQDPQDASPSEPLGLEPRAALEREEDVPAVVDDPSVPAEIRDSNEQRRSAWRGAVEPASNNAIEPQPLESGKYTVQPNDTLWAVSEKVYGTGRYFKAIYEHNRAKLPHADRLAVGTVISVPPAAVLEQNYPSLCPRQRKSALVKPRTIEASSRQRIAAGSNVYVVEEGDTLFDIARYELGKASRWAEIYDLNRETLGEDFDYLQPGTQLTMPAKTQDRDSVTRQRDGGIQR